MFLLMAKKVHIKHRKFMKNTQKAVTSSCLQVGRQVVCSTEVFTFQYVPILAFVYVLLFSIKWRKKYSLEKY